MFTPHPSPRPRAISGAVVLSSAALALVTAWPAAAAPAIEVYQQPARVLGPAVGAGEVGPQIREIAVAATTVPGTSGAVRFSAVPDGEPCPAAGALLVIDWVNVTTGTRGSESVDACGGAAIAETDAGQIDFSTRIVSEGHSPLGSAGSVGAADPAPYLSGNGAFELGATRPAAGG